jgi:hypothetical protein
MVMSAAKATGAAGAAPPPPPPGGGRGNRNTGSDGRRPGQGGSRKKKQRRAAKIRGRPLQNMERMQIMGIWYQLSAIARRSLWETLGEMLGETQAGGPDGPTVSEIGSATLVAEFPRRTRVWERDIIRDVPLFREFGEFTARERRDDTRGIPRLLSIAQGVVHRGLAAQMTPADISAAIIASIEDSAALQSLFGGPPQGDEDSDSDDKDHMND